MIKLEKDDLVQLTTGYIVEIFEDQDKEPYIGFDVNDGESIKFKLSEIECFKKANIEPCGGDNINYWIFYTGIGYKNNTRENIAQWARYTLQDTFFDRTIEQIIVNHMYFATDSGNYKHYYNGDTYILFNHFDKLPEDMQYDAMQ